MCINFWDGGQELIHEIDITVNILLTEVCIYLLFWSVIMFDGVNLILIFTSVASPLALALNL